MKKTDARVQRTYTLLMTALMELMKEREFDNLSVSDICDKAGVHRATFYKHFNDKLEFIRYCFENQLSNIEIDGIIKDPTPENLRAGILFSVEGIFRFVDKNIVILKTICSEKYYMSLGSTFFATLNDFCFSKFAHAIHAPGHKVEILSNFYSSALIGVIKWYVTRNGEDHRDDIHTFIEHRVDELVGYYRDNMYNG